MSRRWDHHRCICTAVVTVHVITFTVDHWTEKFQVTVKTAWLTAIFVDTFAQEVDIWRGKKVVCDGEKGW